MIDEDVKFSTLEETIGGGFVCRSKWNLIKYIETMERSDKDKRESSQIVFQHMVEDWIFQAIDSNVNKSKNMHLIICP